MTEEEWDDYQREEFEGRMEDLKAKYGEEDYDPLNWRDWGVPPPGTRLKMGGW